MCYVRKFFCRFVLLLIQPLVSQTRFFELYIYHHPTYPGYPAHNQEACRLTEFKIFCMSCFEKDMTCIMNTIFGTKLHTSSSLGYCFSSGTHQDPPQSMNSLLFLSVTSITITASTFSIYWNVATIYHGIIFGLFNL